MAFNFPNSPSEGQVFEPAGGPRYVYMGGVWGHSGRTRALIADNPPSGAVHGDLWWDSTDGNLYVFYNDGDSSQYVQCNTPNMVQTTPAFIRQQIITASGSIALHSATTCFQVEVLGGG